MALCTRVCPKTDLSPPDTGGREVSTGSGSASTGSQGRKGPTRVLTPCILPLSVSLTLHGVLQTPVRQHDTYQQSRDSTNIKCK